MKKKPAFLRWLPLAVLAIALFFVFYFRLYTYLNFEALQMHRDVLSMWTSKHYLLASICFMAIYVVAVALSIPGALFLTLAGGFLFGIFWGTVYVVISATLGATLLFLAVRTALGEWLEKRAGDWVAKMEHGFQRNAFNYLLVLRLVPLFPFWLVNIVPGLLNVPLRTYMLATLLGILPGSLVYVMVGNGLSSVFAAGQTPNLSIIFTPPILLPLIGLSILSLAPIIYNKRKRKRHA